MRRVLTNETWSGHVDEVWVGILRHLDLLEGNTAFLEHQGYLGQLAAGVPLQELLVLEEAATQTFPLMPEPLTGLLDVLNMEVVLASGKVLVVILQSLVVLLDLLLYPVEVVLSEVRVNVDAHVRLRPGDLLVV